MQILPAWTVFRLRRVRRGLFGLQKPARRTSSRDGRTHAKEHFTIQTRRIRLHAQYYFLRGSRNIIYRLRFLPTSVAGIAGIGLFDDRIGPALRSSGELFREQEIQITRHCESYWLSSPKEVSKPSPKQSPRVLEIASSGRAPSSQ